MKNDRDQVIEDYQITAEELAPFEVLYHIYDVDGYEGNAYTLLRSYVTGGLYDNEGSHCSCFGLEGQFAPGRTNKQHLLTRLAVADRYTRLPFGAYYDSNQDEVARFRALVEAL